MKIMVWSSLLHICLRGSLQNLFCICMNFLYMSTNFWMFEWFLGIFKQKSNLEKNQRHTVRLRPMASAQRTRRLWHLASRKAVSASADRPSPSATRLRRPMARRDACANGGHRARGWRGGGSWSRRAVVQWGSVPDATASPSRGESISGQKGGGSSLGLAARSGTRWWDETRGGQSEEWWRKELE
jgi:hypothetical protein